MSLNSCVETPAAPEWLSKLENRREELKRTKLGHEAGAGSACNECGDKCPGLDLHFWRKVCRKCKCRKDQHMCIDDDLSGWAQFEILGQIRSKPAFIRIRALASQPVQLEWVPPNAAPDVVSDYMEKLGTAQIPVAGSDAAHKRKQQLEFQVPPHDLDPALCDSLTVSETSQLQQYVQKIRENCVGQGCVVRVGSLGHGLVGQVALSSIGGAFRPEFARAVPAFDYDEVPVSDLILGELLSAEKLTKAIVSDVGPSSPPSSCAKMFIAFAAPISESPAEFEAETMLSLPTKQKLCGLNKAAVKSLVYNGPIYDKILAALKDKNLDLSRDPKLGPIADFRKEYLKNPQFKQEIDAFYRRMNDAQRPGTPIKSNASGGETPFHSPLPLKNNAQVRFGAQMSQDTPIRKVKFGGVSSIIYDCGLPANIEYERDALFAQIVNSDPLKRAFAAVRAGRQATEPVVVALLPLTPDFMDEPALSGPTKRQLMALDIDLGALQSALLNGPFYDRLFQTLAEKNIDYGDCKLLAPLHRLRAELSINKPLIEEVRELIAQMPDSLAVSYGGPPQSACLKNALTGSKSNDSGFDSKPSTPNYGTYPSLPPPMSANDELRINASAGGFVTIPGIVDMNMYPSVEPSAAAQLPHALRNLQLAHNEREHIQAPIHQQPPSHALNCRDCEHPISFGEVAVKAERAGKEIAWHPECFKCFTCRELLADLVYFFHGGQVYCGRDLAIKLKIPRCKACDELIFTKEYTAAEGATFHIKHFCCYQCDSPLAGQQYIPDEKSNMPLCLKCYDEFFAAACQRCRRPIGPADQGVVWGEVHWHGSCFNCAGSGCDKSLIGGRFCVKQNMPFCSPACVRSIIK